MGLSLRLRPLSIIHHQFSGLFSSKNVASSTFLSSRHLITLKHFSNLFNHTSVSTRFVVPANVVAPRAFRCSIPISFRDLLALFQGSEQFYSIVSSPCPPQLEGYCNFRFFIPYDLFLVASRVPNGWLPMGSATSRHDSYDVPMLFIHLMNAYPNLQMQDS